MAQQPSIFISYRRNDARDQARLIYLELAQHLRHGKEAVFFDYENLQAGDKWDNKLRTSVAQSYIVFYVIQHFGKWYGADEFGERRIEQEDDWIANEIQIGLEENKILIPVLVNNPKMPTEAQQPPIVQKLLKNQVISLETADLHTDILKLVERIHTLLPHLKPLPAAPVSSAPAIAAPLRVPAHLKHTCDRRVPFNVFKSWLVHNHVGSQRCHFFFLSGHADHAHLGLFERILLALKGLDRANATSANVDYAVKGFSIPINDQPDLSMLIKETTWEVMNNLGVPRTRIEQVATKNMAFVLAEGAKVNQLTRNDKLCIQLIFRESVWDSNLTPDIARQFMEEFCKGGITDAHPQVLFFFSIEEENVQNAKILGQIKGGMTNSELIYDLGSLDMVASRDIQDWFRDFSTLDRVVQDQMRENAFGANPSPLFMYVVEHKLADTINQINKLEAYENRNS